MQIIIRTSEANKTIVSELTRRMFPQGQTENVVSRIALSYSLSKGHHLDLSKIRDKRGKEYKEDTLFGSFRSFYVALVCQHYGIHKEDLNLPNYIKLHVDDGLERLNKIFAENKSYTGLDFLIENIDRGVETLDDIVPGAVENRHQNLSKDFYPDPIKLLLGYHLDGTTPIEMNLNDTRFRPNAHMAIAGKSGTGKTQLALEILRQISEGSNGTVKFLYLDFKGLMKEDLKRLQPFFDRTKTTFINAPDKPFPVNPLAFIDNVNEKSRLMGIAKFADIISTYAPKIGAIQTQQLKDATKEAFARQKGGTYPTIKDVTDCLFEITGGRPDTLSEIMQSLSEYEVFDSKAKNDNAFLNQNYYFSLTGSLSKSLRSTSVFLTIYYLYNTFMNMEDTPVVDAIKSLRYVILIDEAHVIFKDRKAQGLLESILREIRSKGVSVILLSQGIEEFNQPNFDFSSECANSILMEISDRVNLKPMQRFLGYGEPQSRLLAQSMSRIEGGQAITNIKEFKQGQLFQVSQFWQNL